MLFSESSALSVKGQRKRELILKHAAEFLGRKGYSAFQLAEFAKNSGIAAPLILYYFGSIAGLFEQLVYRTVARGRELAEKYASKAEPGESALRAWVDSMFDWIASDRPAQVIMMQYYSETRFNDRLASLNADVVRVGRERVEQVILAGIRVGQFRFPGMRDPRRVRTRAEALHDLITGALMKILSNPKGADLPSTRHRTLETSLELLGAAARHRQVSTGK
jgi:AcrR family transcriptional regulator